MSCKSKYKRITGVQVKEASVDSGYRGRKKEERVLIIAPKPLLPGATYYQNIRKRK